MRRTGRARLNHDKSLEDTLPHSDTRRPTFYLYEQAHTDFFGTRSCLGASAWLRVRERAGGRASASRSGEGCERGLHSCTYRIWRREY